MSERARLINKAMAAELTMRHGEMLSHMKKVVELNASLTNKDLKLLFKAYKLKMGKFRKEMHLIKNFIAEQAHAPLTPNKEGERQMAQNFYQQIKQDMRDMCMEVFELIENKLSPHTNNVEYNIECIKTQADFQRYMLTFCNEDEKGRLRNEAHKNYQTANEMAQQLPTTNTTRLNLVINYTVFLHETLDLKDVAEDMLKKHFDQASKQMDELSFENYKETSAVLKLMYGNTKQWSKNRRIAKRAEIAGTTTTTAKKLSAAVAATLADSGPSTSKQLSLEEAAKSDEDLLTNISVAKFRYESGSLSE